VLVVTYQSTDFSVRVGSIPFAVAASLRLLPPEFFIAGQVVVESALSPPFLPMEGKPQAVL